MPFGMEGAVQVISNEDELTLVTTTFVGASSGAEEVKDTHVVNRKK